MDTMLKNKIAVVTGGTKGIGLEISKTLAKEGATVIACARNEVKFENKNIHFFKLDVSNTDNCQELYDYVVSKYGRIDVLVCDAGITSDSMTHKMSDEDFNRVIDVDLKGIFNVVRLFGPFMEKQGSGSIINVSSVVGQFGNIGQANYAAAKAGIIGMSLSWAKEFARKGAPIRVNVVSPGFIDTDMIKGVPDNILDNFKNKIMLKRIGSPSEVANVVLFLASDLSSYITGEVISVNGGLRF